MTFSKGNLCELHVLEEQHAPLFTAAVNAGLTTQHLFTGSIPMRTADYWQRWEDEREKGSVQFAIYAVGEDNLLHYVGTCGLHSHQDIYRTWEFRILIFDPRAIGKGVGTEATRLLVDYAFNRLNAHLIWLGVNVENVGAVKCYEKVGFKREGELRDRIFCYGHYVNTLPMSITEDEWRSIAH